jgi:hypothetical protein
MYAPPETKMLDRLRSLYANLVAAWARASLA